MLKPVASNLSLGPHSLRLEREPAAANNTLSDQFISKHGRQKSDKGRNEYIQNSNLNRLEMVEVKTADLVYLEIYFSPPYAQPF